MDGRGLLGRREVRIGIGPLPLVVRGVKNLEVNLNRSIGAVEENDKREMLKKSATSGAQPRASEP